MQAIGLIDLLRLPRSVLSVAEADWNDIVEQASRSQLLGQLAARLKRENLFDHIPGAVQRHLALAELTSQRRSEAALWEVGVIRRAVDPEIRLVLLKGCAYIASGDQNSAGRMFSDIDVLVQKDVLPKVEADLISSGWKPSRVSDYDLNYYRNWMHEVPAMEHVRRHTVVDLHHAINPPVSRFFIALHKLWDQMIEISPGIYVLSPIDRIIHCALHLIQEGEPRKLIRDLYDLHQLIGQHFPGTSDLSSLLARAKALGVEPLVGSAIAAANQIFTTDEPASLGRGWLRSCLIHATSLDKKQGGFTRQLAGSTLLAYSHLIKMPLPLLVPHLLRKSWVK